MNYPVYYWQFFRVDLLSIIPKWNLICLNLLHLYKLDKKHLIIQNLPIGLLHIPLLSEHVIKTELEVGSNARQFDESMRYVSALLSSNTEFPSPRTESKNDYWTWNGIYSLVHIKKIQGTSYKGNLIFDSLQFGPAICIHFWCGMK